MVEQCPGPAGCLKAALRFEPTYVIDSEADHAMTVARADKSTQALVAAINRQTELVRREARPAQPWFRRARKWFAEVFR